MRLPIKNQEREDIDVTGERSLTRSWRLALFEGAWACRIVGRGLLAMADAMIEARKEANKRLSEGDLD
jgi:hypothetical protein